jgi:NAD(P)-dependent dehydrogenase (short-subunit alcohol dehydrogenase family)
MDIANSVAFVTGGNRGIGEAFVRAFVAAGARRVYVGTRRLDAAAHLVAEAPDRVVAVELDVANQDSIARAARECQDVSILVNNAGQFLQQTLLTAPDLSSARMEMEVNYFGPLAMCRAFAPILARSRPSAIANVLSAGGLVAVPIMGGYSPSKFAARAMSTCLRAELAAQATTVTALFVGSVDTRMASHVKGAKEKPETIASAGLAAIQRGAEEVDTDRMAIEVRASTIREPEALARRFARQLGATEISTGR